jgi:hypothetical protein
MKIGNPHFLSCVLTAILAIPPLVAEADPFYACQREAQTICAKRRGQALNNCLRANTKNLSKKCRGSLLSNQISNLDVTDRHACKADASHFCYFGPDNTKTACLRKHYKKLSKGCRAWLDRSRV